MIDPIVFLPGWGFKRSVWQSIIHQLNLPNMLICDLPTPLQHDDLNTIIRALNSQIPEQAIIVGWSLGGLLGIALCHAYPEKYKQLMLVASTPRFCADNDWDGICNSDKAAFMHLANTKPLHLIKRFTHLICYPSIDRHLYLFLQKHVLDNWQTLYFYLNLLFNVDLRFQFNSLTLPISHVAGSHDAIIKPSVTSSVIQGAGHGLIFTHTDIFISHLKAFINENI